MSALCLTTQRSCEAPTNIAFGPNVSDIQAREFPLITGNAEPIGKRNHSVVATIGLVLAPVAISLCLLDVAVAIFGIAQHAGAVASPATTFGITPVRKLVAIVSLAFWGLVSVAAAAFLLWDWMGIGLCTRRRLSLIGWLVTPLSLASFFVIEFFPHGF